MQSFIKFYVMIVVFTTTIYGENPMDITIKNENFNWIPIVTLGIVLCGFIATIYAARLNKKIEVLSKNRQDWINTLRNELSNYMGRLSEIKNLTELLKREIRSSNSSNEDDSLLHKNNSIDGAIPVLQELYTIKTKIELLLNPTEPDSKELVRLLNISYTNMFHKFEDEDKNINEIINISQIILKKEWDRVKKAE